MRDPIVAAAAAALLAGLPAAAPAQTPAPSLPAVEESVSIPSLPALPNRSGLVRPDASLPIDTPGFTVLPLPPPPATPGPSGSRSVDWVPPARDRIPAGPLARSVPSGDENDLTFGGVVEAIRPGRSITVRVRSGRSLTFRLDRWARVAPRLSPGEAVRVRALVGADGDVADRVARRRPGAPEV